MFGDFGDAESDLSGQLYLNGGGVLFSKENPPYPRVDSNSIDITSEYLNLQNFIDECCNLLTDKTSYDVNYWLTIISEYF